MIAITLRSGRIQGLSATLVRGHIQCVVGSWNKYFYSLLEGCRLFTSRGPEFCGNGNAGYRVSKGLNGSVSDFRKWAYIYDEAKKTEGNAAAQKVAGLLFISSCRNLLINKGF